MAEIKVHKGGKIKFMFGTEPNSVESDFYDFKRVEPLELSDFHMTGTFEMDDQSRNTWMKWQEEARQAEVFARIWPQYLWTYWQMSAIAVCAGALCLETGAWELPDSNGLIPGYTVDLRELIGNPALKILA